MVKSYILTKEFKSPDVINTPTSFRPANIKLRTFRKGEIINGELKHANNEPAFVLVQGRLVVPLSVLREVVTREISSGASGVTTSGEQRAEDRKPAIVVTKGKVKMLDAMVIGAIVGVVGVIVAEKQGWIAMPNKKNKMWGAIGGAVAGVYLSYRLKNK